MHPKQLGLTADDFIENSDESLDLLARAVSTVVEYTLDRRFDQKLAAASSGDTDAERYFYVGLEWLEFLIRYGRLSPSGRVLDIGCGNGRMAAPLSYYIKDGAYYGFDPQTDLIEYCKKTIRRPNFSFEHIDLSHPIYNRKGAIPRETFTFKYQPDFFDVVFAASIFTHIDAATAKNYLSQIATVLRPGGIALLSFFAIPEAATRTVGQVTPRLGLGEGEYSYCFRKLENGQYIHCDLDGVPKNHYFSDPIGDPVAYETASFSEMCAASGLQTVADLTGAWNGIPYLHGWQDMLVLKKIVT